MINSLTFRERQVLRSICRGDRLIDFAARKDLSLQTVKNHAQNLRNKLGIHKNTELINYAIRVGFYKVPITQATSTLVLDSKFSTMS